MHIEEIRETIVFNYEPSSESPSRIFRSIEELLNNFEALNSETAKSVDPSIDIKFLLEEIEAGSILIKILKRILTPDDGDTLAIPDVQGNVPMFIENTQEIVVDALVNSKDEPITNEQINVISEKIHQEAIKTGVDGSGNYRRINKIQIAEKIESIENTCKEFKPGEGIVLPYRGGVAEVKNVQTKLNISEIKKEMVDRVIPNTSTQILMIKIADFLGKSKWKFKCGDDTIEAKIIDQDWLKRFHKKEDQIGPGDSIEAEVLQKDYYDKYGRKFDSESFVIKVIAIREGVVENDLAG